MKTTHSIGGIFIGGASRRMGQPKGLLIGPDGQRLVDRARAVLRAAGLTPVLVGQREAYADEGAFVADAIENAGPLAGLVGLLEHAAGERVVALACDMPFVTTADIETLLAMQAPIVAPRRDGRWEPLCAAYDASVLGLARERLMAGRRSLQGLLNASDTLEVAITATHLVDWDTPEDISAS